jgi:hypothetical protein
MDRHRIDVILLCSIPAGSRSGDRGHYLISTWPHSGLCCCPGSILVPRTLWTGTRVLRPVLPIWIQGFRLIYDAMTPYLAKKPGNLLHSKHELPWGFTWRKDRSLPSVNHVVSSGLSPRNLEHQGSKQPLHQTPVITRLWNAIDLQALLT